MRAPKKLRVVALGNGGFLYDCCVLHVSTRLYYFKNFGITFSISNVHLLSFSSSLCLVICIDVYSRCNEGIIINTHVSLIAKCFKIER